MDPSNFLSEESKSLFPLQTIPDLEKLFEIECIKKDDPNLTVISIILGAVENSLVQLDYSKAKLVEVGGVVSNNNSTIPPVTRKSVGGVVKRRKGKGKPIQNVEFKEGRPISGGKSTNGEVEEGTGPSSNGKISEEDDGTSDKENSKGDFPPLELDLVEALFLNFKIEYLKKYADLKQFGLEEGFAVENTPSEMVSRVASIVWCGLLKSYKTDTPHIQSLYSYLIDNKLDSLGLTFAVTAGCQLLGFNDVHLIMSEDHSWVGFGGTDENNCPKQTVEVTWHGKGVEDRRGHPVPKEDEEDSWLYQRGHAVYCTRHMEVAAMISSISPAINNTLNSIELMKIQQRLLWKLYENGHLKKYPMGLLTLADGEELKPTLNKPSCQTLYLEAILSGRTYYSDHHIFPYTTYAAYCFRKGDYKTALKYWAHAARIVQKFRRSKNDEEIYREFFEISTDALVTVMKSCSTGFSANSIVRDPMSFAHLLRFFDGICAWEEKSKSSIVHITWAKAWVSAIGRFDYTIRRLVALSDGKLMETLPKNETKENGSIGEVDELEKDSGIDDEDDATPRVTLFSRKMQQMKGFFKNEKYNPGGINLILTAQTAVEDTTVDKESGNGTGAGVRSRRTERLSQHSEVSKIDMDEDSSEKPPARKRGKLSVS